MPAKDYANRLRVGVEKFHLEFRRRRNGEHTRGFFQLHQLTEETLRSSMKEFRRVPVKFGKPTPSDYFLIARNSHINDFPARNTYRFRYYFPIDHHHPTSSIAHPAPSSAQQKARRAQRFPRYKPKRARAKSEIVEKKKPDPRAPAARRDGISRVARRAARPVNFASEALFVLSLTCLRVLGSPPRAAFLPPRRLIFSPLALCAPRREFFRRRRRRSDRGGDKKKKKKKKRPPQRD